MLTEAARRADIISLNPNLRSGTVGVDAARSSVAEKFAERRQWIADAAGDRFADIEIQPHTFMALVSDDADSVLAQFAPGFGVTLEEARETPLVLAGTVDDICEQLHHHREAYGASYIVIHDPEVDAMAPVVARLPAPEPAGGQRGEARPFDWSEAQLDEAVPTAAGVVPAGGAARRTPAAAAAASGAIPMPK